MLTRDDWMAQAHATESWASPNAYLVHSSALRYPTLIETVNRDPQKKKQIRKGARLHLDCFMWVRGCGTSVMLFFLRGSPGAPLPDSTKAFVFMAPAYPPSQQMIAIVQSPAFSEEYLNCSSFLSVSLSPSLSLSLPLPAMLPAKLSILSITVKANGVMLIGYTCRCQIKWAVGDEPPGHLGT